MPRLPRITSLLISTTIFFASVASPQTSPRATLTFAVDFPKSQPEHCSIQIKSDGAGHYTSSGLLWADSDETDDFQLDFTVAPKTRQKLFELAAKAGYFQKDLASHNKNLAFTGKKTLAYRDSQRAGESTYNYSSNAAVQELTAMMQALGTTLEFGRRLQYDHQYQKLALDEELKRMEEMSRSHELIQITAIQPILDQIVADQSVINVSRARAKRLLDAAGAR